MQKKLLSSIVVLLAAVPAWALQVEVTPGGLQSQVTDTTITELTVTGQIDARDFGFISNSLPNLESVNLAGASIVAYSNADEPVFGAQTSYEALRLPTMSFFGKTKLASVVLPQGIKSIGYAAFGGCTKLAAIDLPASVDSIGGYAFTATGLVAVTLPQGVRMVGEGAFSRCLSLTSVTVPAGVVGDKAFQADASLASVTLGDVTALGDASFSGCTALKGLSLQNPAVLESVGAEAFVESGITSFDMSGMTALKSIGDFAFAGTGITIVDLPESIVSLGEGAFYYMSGVTSIVLPQNVTAVPAYLLAGTAVQNSDMMLKRTTSIGDYALYNLSAYETFQLPYELTHIGTKAMAGMTGLKRIIAINPTPAELGDSVWAGLDQSQVELLATSLDYQDAEQWRDFQFSYSSLRGDVNHDGNVDASDVTALIAYITGQEVAYFDPIAAELTGEGNIDVTDVTTLVNLIISGTSTLNVPAATTTDAITLSDIEIEPGDTAQVEVKLNSSEAYAAMQFDVTLPAGLEFVSGTVEAADRSSSHQWVSGMLSDSTLRLMAFSLVNATIGAGQGTVARFTVRGTEQLPVESVVSVDNVVLASSRGVPSYASAAQSRVSNTSGVDDITATRAKVYAYNGILVIDSDKACAAQLVAVNGIVRTLLVQSGHNEYSGLAAGVYMVRLGGATHKVAIK